MIATYDEALRSILGLPTLEAESRGARRVVQCLFKPSFHPECAISLVERGGAAELTLRVAARPVWALVGAGQGAGGPAAGWATPAVSTEHVPSLPPEVAAAWRSAVDALAGARPPERATIGADGMSVEVRLWPAPLEAAFSLWLGPLDVADARHRLLRAVVDSASAAARQEQSVAALRNLRAYLDDAPSLAR